MVLEVSEQGYYKWLKTREKPYKHESLLAKIKAILAQDEENKNYGYKRMHTALVQEYHITQSVSTIYRVMKENNLLVYKASSRKGLTVADPEKQASENIIKQDFTADTPNTKWLGDITEILTADGKLYISAVLDTFDGAIVGLKMDDNMRAELCDEAFISACKKTNATGMIFHSDRGSQYTSNVFRATLKKYEAIQSMSHTGRCYDNARMESFFATLKKEKLYKIKTKEMSMGLVKQIVYRYIEFYYNRKRIYTTNGGYPPLVFRDMYYNKINKVAA